MQEQFSGINDKEFRYLSSRHFEDLIKNRTFAKDLRDIETLKQIVYPSFLRFALPYCQVQEKSKLQDVLKIASFGDPGKWYPLARSIERRIYAHVGPTNSGKTFAAINRLKASASGIYCGPLRLLAMEMYDKLNSDNIPCALITGEAVEPPTSAPGIAAKEAPFVSSTVEMFNFQRKVDCVVIDEIQMMTDRERGWAFTQVLLGAYASEIHVCGEESIIPLLEKICLMNKEIVELIKYERLSPLYVATKSIEQKQFMNRGDCFVTFSRNGVYKLKDTIEKKTRKKCAVVYGGLPLESRRLQAKLFNDPNSDYHFLVATDAIGMGLNLNIGRIIFQKLVKYNGSLKEFLTPAQTKQIAGRAGRFNSEFSQGEVTTMKKPEISFLKELMETPIEPHTKAGLMPTIQIVQEVSKVFPACDLADILQMISGVSTVEADYFLCHLDSEIASLLRGLDLSIEKKFSLLGAPVKRNCKITTAAFVKFANHLVSKNPVQPFVKIPKLVAVSETAVEELEARHRFLTLYSWFAIRYPSIFPMLQAAKESKRTLEFKIIETLDRISCKGTRTKGSSKPEDLLKYLEEVPQTSDADYEQGIANKEIGEQELEVGVEELENILSKFKT